jgi:serpin B
LRNQYDANLSRLNFAAPVEAAAKINHWVAQKTNDKIDKLVGPRDLPQRGGGLVLTNAVYFRGTWTTQFDPKLTQPAPFHINAATTKDVPMMRQTSGFRHLAAGPYDMIELPYVGNQVSMIILLPRETHRSGAAASGPADAAALSSLSSESLHQWLRTLDQQKPAQLAVFLPKFKIACSYRLRTALTGMGMAAAFSDADFSGISELPAGISEVIHETLTEVNEEGTEAAAATAVILGRSASQIFLADHPFLFLIRHNPSGTILFLGRVVDPSLRSG